MSENGQRKKGHKAPIKEKAQQRATLASLSTVLSSPLWCLTSVFGMGTGVTTTPKPPDFFLYSMFFEYRILLYHVLLLNCVNLSDLAYSSDKSELVKLSPRAISISLLNALQRLQI